MDNDPLLMLPECEPMPFENEIDSVAHMIGLDFHGAKWKPDGSAGHVVFGDYERDRFMGFEWSGAVTVESALESLRAMTQSEYYAFIDWNSN